MNIDEVISLYMRLRNEKAAIEADTKEKVADIKAKMAKVEAYIKQLADDQGVTSFKTKSGTAFVTTVDFASVSDWDAVLDYIKAHEAYDLLEKRVAKKAVREVIDSLGQVPPGVNYGTKIEVNFRKPATTIEDDNG